MSKTIALRDDEKKVADRMEKISRSIRASTSTEAIVEYSALIGLGVAVMAYHYGLTTTDKSLSRLLRRVMESLGEVVESEIKNGG